MAYLVRVDLTRKLLGHANQGLVLFHGADTVRVGDRVHHGLHGGVHLLQLFGVHIINIGAVQLLAEGF